MAMKIGQAILAAAAVMMTLATPSFAQRDPHQRTLNRLAMCRTTQVATIAHLNAMARGAHNGREHRQTIARLAECRDIITAAIAHLNDMERASTMHH
jgi:hypothetical protein